MSTGNRSQDWLKQAESDLRFARAALREGFFEQTCFICQQSAEKALKSMAYAKGSIRFAESFIQRAGGS